MITSLQDRARKHPRPHGLRADEHELKFAMSCTESENSIFKIIENTQFISNSRCGIFKRYDRCIALHKAEVLSDLLCIQDVRAIVCMLRSVMLRQPLIHSFNWCPPGSSSASLDFQYCTVRVCVTLEPRGS